MIVVNQVRKKKCHELNSAAKKCCTLEKQFLYAFCFVANASKNKNLNTTYGFMFG